VRIRSLRIKNFRAIEYFDIEELGDFIVIAGPNGCGKSTVFDAIRLLKSVYVPHEWNRWFSEFGLNLEKPKSIATLFRDKNQPLTIEAEFSLAENEQKFIRERAQNIVRSLLLMGEQKTPIVTGDPPVRPPEILTENNSESAESDVDSLVTEMDEALKSSSHFSAAVKIGLDASIELASSPVAHAAFSCFNPDNLGEIEFHGSRRYYARESVESIKLRVSDRSEERRSRFLYDFENKYRNIKTQLGEEYVVSILKSQNPLDAPLQKSIKELFKTFFPGKEFLGVQLGEGNALSFPVKLSTGEIHDIDELSSGEKEIVYGYLGLRTGTPRQSIILVDEPELHLNPALIQGLPTFYKLHLADALDAQVWIVTHSDAILRQAVRAPTTAVYHMARPRGDGAPQAVKINSRDAVEAAVLDLIGDLAAYRPYAKIVLIEGNSETRFDAEMIRRLFPDIAERANIIPVGSRRMTAGVRVRLLEVLSVSGLTGRAASISDGDLNLARPVSESDGNHFVWPVYEIENFLLVPDVLRGAARVMLGREAFANDAELMDRLRSLAENLVNDLAITEIQELINDEFMQSLSIGGSKANPVGTMSASATAAKERIAALEVDADRVKRLFDYAEARFRKFLESSEYLKRFPGDRLLRALAGHLGVNGDHFRNVCLEQAQRLGLRPPEMQKVLEEALK
jgi:predicted ATPase